MSGGAESSLGVVGTVLGSAMESTEGGERSLHHGMLAWDVGWMENLQTQEVWVVGRSQSAESGFPFGASPPRGW